MTTPEAVRARHLEDALAVAEERFFATFELAPWRLRTWRRTAACCA